MIARLLASIILILPSYSFAAGFFCSKTNQYVYTGDSINTVLQRCGAPDTTKQVKIPATVTTVPGQRWVYKYQPQQYSNSNKQALANTGGAALLVIYFNRTQVAQIFVYGNMVKKTDFCGTNPSLELGMSYLKARSICGVPSEVRNIQLPQQQQPGKQIEWIYKNGYGQTSLVFQHSKLTTIKQ